MKATKKSNKRKVLKNQLDLIQRCLDSEKIFLDLIDSGKLKEKDFWNSVENSSVPDVRKR